MIGALAVGTAIALLYLAVLAYVYFVVSSAIILIDGVREYRKMQRAREDWPRARLVR